MPPTMSVSQITRFLIDVSMWMPTTSIQLNLCDIFALYREKDWNWVVFLRLIYLLMALCYTRAVYLSFMTRKARRLKLLISRESWNLGISFSLRSVLYCVRYTTIQTKQQSPTVLFMLSTWVYYIPLYVLCELHVTSIFSNKLLYYNMWCVYCAHKCAIAATREQLLVEVLGQWIVDC